MKSEYDIKFRELIRKLTFKVMLTHYSSSSLKEKKESTNDFNTVEVNQFYSYIVVEVILLLIKGLNQATFRSLSNIQSILYYSQILMVIIHGEYYAM